MRFSDLTDFLLDLILPPVCLVCRKRGEFLCEKCKSKVEINNTFFCAKCGARLPDNKKICHPDSYILGAAGFYKNEVLREMISGLKYKGFKVAAPILAEVLLEYLRRTGFDLNGWTIAPIPLYSSRERKRGFNQARLAAEELVRLIPGAILADILTRTKNTKSQTEFKEEDKRLANVTDCFALAEPNLMTYDVIRLGRFIVLDDVFTSGATMNEAVKVLKKAGARQVAGLVIVKA